MAKKKNTGGWLRFRTVARWAVVFVSIAVILYGAFDLWSFANRADLFLVRRVQVDGNFLLEEGEILEAMQVPARVRIWEVEPALLESRIVKLSLAQDVTVKRVLPHTLLVNISERNPIADWVDPLSKTRYVLDEEGVVLCRGEELKERIKRMGESVKLSRPEIRGLSAREIRPGDSIEGREMKRVLSAYGIALSRDETWTRSVKSFQIDPPSTGWIIRCSGRLKEIRLGEKNFLERLGALESIYQFLKQEQLVVAYVDLRFEEQGVIIGNQNLDPANWLSIASRYPRPTAEESRFGFGNRT